MAGSRLLYRTEEDVKIVSKTVMALEKSIRLCGNCFWMNYRIILMKKARDPRKRPDWSKHDLALRASQKIAILMLVLMVFGLITINVTELGLMALMRRVLKLANQRNVIILRGRREGFLKPI